MRCQTIPPEVPSYSCQSLAVDTLKVSLLPEQSSSLLVLWPFFATFTAIAESDDNKIGMAGRRNITGDLAGLPCKVMSLTAT